ncbi:hypothetical protein PISL3812_05469 [Talaromyces islandicus]|uniref:Uncharacterized protein n=1 Tax=Talaromyces islandicus TaxID=28573 RepID=A0A0U1LYN8_TALIS|nr:hypothetical protein PISL3812_05469 [Talaromyces islandicus]
MSSVQSNQPVANQTGLSTEIWETLKRGDIWGSIATEVQNLARVRDVHSLFVHSDDIIAVRPPRSFRFFNNPRMHLEELRFGVIQSVAGEKPAVWLIVRHEKELSGSQISRSALFTCSIATTSSSNGIADVLYPGISVDVHNIAEIGSDTYALLCMNAENLEQGTFEDDRGQSLGMGETLIVQLVNSRMDMKHQSAVWSG